MMDINHSRSCSFEYIDIDCPGLCGRAIRAVMYIVASVDSMFISFCLYVAWFIFLFRLSWLAFVLSVSFQYCVFETLYLIIVNYHLLYWLPLMWWLLTLLIEKCLLLFPRVTWQISLTFSVGITFTSIYTKNSTFTIKYITLPVISRLSVPASIFSAAVSTMLSPNTFRDGTSRYILNGSEHFVGDGRR